MAFIEAGREGDVLWLTLNRPERLNAVHLAMRDELWTMFELIRLDTSIRACVFRGAGDRAFSAGADILEFGTAPSVIAAREARQQRDLWGLMSQLPVPLVAAIHGFAYGAGLEMSMYCDLRVAAEDATFALPEVTLGYIPSAGGTQTVPRHAPGSDALLLATSGEPYTAAQAFEAGLVHSVVPRADLEATTRSWAQRLASLPSEAMRATKRAVIEGIDLPLTHALTLEHTLAASVGSA